VTASQVQSPEDAGRMGIDTAVQQAAYSGQEQAHGSTTLANPYVWL